MRQGFGFHHHAHHWGAMGFVMPLLWLLFVAVIAWFVLRLIRQGAFHAPHTAVAAGARETPEEVLDRRFALGEIDAEAHAAARQHLRDHPR